MAITKILSRNDGLKQAIEYVLNGDKTQEQVLTAHLNCDPGFEYIFEEIAASRAAVRTSAKNQDFPPSETLIFCSLGRPPIPRNPSRPTGCAF